MTELLGLPKVQGYTMYQIRGLRVADLTNSIVEQGVWTSKEASVKTTCGT